MSDSENEYSYPSEKAINISETYGEKNGNVIIDDKIDRRIEKIVIWSDEFINAIQIYYEGGKKGKKYGGDGGKKKKLELEENEYIKSVVVRCGNL
jgi:hypothetical protein